MLHVLHTVSTLRGVRDSGYIEGTGTSLDSLGASDVTFRGAAELKKVSRSSLLLIGLTSSPSVA